MLQYGIGYSDLIKIIYSRKRVMAFVIDETMIQIGGRNEAWLWITIEPVRSTVLGVYLSRHRNMLVAESFLCSLIEIYGRHTVYSDGGGTWYSEACSSLGLKHRLHTSSEKSLIERAIQYFNDRTEHFDDYYPCKSKVYHHMVHVYNWMSLFVFMHNSDIQHIRFMALAHLMRGDEA